ncbi:MAG: rubredoxin-like domain-containing protein [Candidatus Heimdallarchaeaceae archaeon]|jgi:uncharacterized membrane protein/rubredoxin
MVQFVRCKVCGYIIAESKVKDVCPACGVPKKAFEPYESKVSEKRMKILDLNIHPMLVHFPQGFVPAILLLTILTAAFNDPYHGYFLVTLQIFGIALPFVIVAAMGAGMLDGVIRYKSFTTPMLKQKLMLGGTALILSILLTISVFLIDATSLEILWSIVLSLLLLGCSILLGLIGGKLTCQVRVGK